MDSLGRSGRLHTPGNTDVLHGRRADGHGAWQLARQLQHVTLRKLEAMADSPAKALMLEDRVPDTAAKRRQVVEWLLREGEAPVLASFLEHVPVAVGSVRHDGRLDLECLQVLVNKLLDGSLRVATLVLSGAGIGDAGAKLLAMVLRANVPLAGLNLACGSISHDGGTALFEALAANSSLIDLEMRGNPIGDAGVVAAAGALGANRTLARLGLGESGCTGDGFEAIGKALARNTALVKLDLSDNSAGARGAQGLAEALATNTTLTQLQLSATEPGDSGAASIASSLKKNPALTHLGLSNNPFSAEGLAGLSLQLGHCTSLKHLDLTETGMDAQGAALHLAGLLAMTRTLVSLQVGAEDIGNDGANAMVRALGANTGLRRLVIRDAGLEAAAVAGIDGVLKTNRDLAELDLSGNTIGSEGAATIATGLSHHTALASLHLEGNGIGDDGCETLAAALGTNTTVISLGLANNDIGDNGAKALASLLCTSRSLVSLDLTNNKIQVDGMTHLAQALAKNTCLIRLSVGGNAYSVEANAMLPQVLAALRKTMEANHAVLSLRYGGLFDADAHIDGRIARNRTEHLERAAKAFGVELFGAADIGIAIANPLLAEGETQAVVSLGSLNRSIRDATTDLQPL